MWPIILKIISKIPDKYLIKYLVNFWTGIKHNPILSIVVILIMACNIFYFYSGKNSNFSTSIKMDEIKDEINKALNHFGNGSTIARISIGTEYYLDNKISFTTDIVRSCDKNLMRYASKGKCDLDVRWINPAWTRIHEIDNRSLEALNQDEIKLGTFNLNFQDGVPLCLNIFNEDRTPNRTGKLLKEFVPSLFLILDESKRTIENICIVRIRHPIYRHIVYLFTLSFWYNDYGRPEMNFIEDKIKILKRLAKIQKRQLL